MRTPSDKEIKVALDRAKQECPDANTVKIVDTAWAILSWEFPHVDDKRIEKQYRKEGEK